MLSHFWEGEPESEWEDSHFWAAKTQPDKS